MYAVGVKSGISFDMINATLVQIHCKENQSDIKVIDTIRYEVPMEMKKQLMEVYSVNNSTVDLICSLNFKLGHLYAEAVKAVCKKCNISLRDIEYIASKGETIQNLIDSGDSAVKSTLQMGKAAVISYKTGIKVIPDFNIVNLVPNNSSVVG